MGAADLDLSDPLVFDQLVNDAAGDAWQFIRAHWPDHMPPHGDFGRIADDYADEWMTRSVALSRDAIRKSVAAALAGGTAHPDMPSNYKRIVRNLYRYIFTKEIALAAARDTLQHCRYSTTQPPLLGDAPQSAEYNDGLDEAQPTVPMQVIKRQRREKGA